MALIGKLSPPSLASHKGTGLRPSYSTADPATVYAPVKAVEEGSSTWSLALGSWLWSGPDLVITTTWMEDATLRASNMLLKFKKVKTKTLAFSLRIFF